jgi:hypothetical protein
MKVGVRVNVHVAVGCPDVRVGVYEPGVNVNAGVGVGCPDVRVGVYVGVFVRVYVAEGGGVLQGT